MRHPSIFIHYLLGATLGTTQDGTCLGRASGSPQNFLSLMLSLSLSLSLSQYSAAPAALSVLSCSLCWWVCRMSCVSVCLGVSCLVHNPSGLDFLYIRRSRSKLARTTSTHDSLMTASGMVHGERYGATHFQHTTHNTRQSIMH